MSEYLSSVVHSGQVNGPPGGYRTVKEWARHSFMTKDSSVLEIGCTTGFITIELARYTGASCVGIDLHLGSVQKAQGNVDSYIADRVQFKQSDAGALPFSDNLFSHVVIGGHLPFIPAQARENHVHEAMRVIRPWGYLLTALYYYRVEPPSGLVERFNAKIGTNLSPHDDRAYWSGLFDNVSATLEFESRYRIHPSDKGRTRVYLEQLDRDTRNDWNEYLELFNANGQYLNYFVRIYRKVPNVSGILVQIPRGGIYIASRETREDF